MIVKSKTFVKVIPDDVTKTSEVAKKISETLGWSIGRIFESRGSFVAFLNDPSEPPATEATPS